MKSEIVTRTLVSLLLCLSSLQATAGGQINIFNWEDYIDPEIVEQFTLETGIKVRYDEFTDGDEVEQILLAGGGDYDVAVTSLSFISQQLNGGRPVIKALDRRQLDNTRYLSGEIMEQLGMLIPRNAYAVPYLWGTTGIGYNKKQVQKVLGRNAPLNSWELVFNVENLKKLSSCGVAFVDEPADVLPTMLNYMKEDPYTLDSKVYYRQAKALLKKIKPYVRYFDSEGQYYEDLAAGKLCVVVGWSTDVLTMQDSVASNIEIDYIVPREGAPAWFDMMVIPRQAPNPEGAHAFINFMMRPEIAAKNSEYNRTASANVAAKKLLSKEMTEHPGIYPDLQNSENLFLLALSPPRLSRLQNNIWNDVTQ